MSQPLNNTDFESIYDENYDDEQARKLYFANCHKRKTALVLCFFLGWLGIHHYYEKRIFWGILYSLTMGLMGIGWIVDIFRLSIANHSAKKSMHFCLNQKCQKPLPKSYKYHYCENCMGNRVAVAKKAGGVLAGIALCIVPLAKALLKKK